MSSKSAWKQFPHPTEPPREETVVKEGEKTIPFLRRLIDMLQENDEVISFYPGVPNKTAGRIVVHDRSRVESEILPRYFNHASFASLRRQLNYFCFSRVGKGKQRGATYCNEHVIELHDILRLKRRVAGSNTAQIPESRKEPKEEEVAQTIQQPSVRHDTIVQASPQSKSCSSQDVNISMVRKKFNKSSRPNKKRKRLLNSIVPVVHLAKRVVMEVPICDSKEQTYEDQTTGTVSPPNSVYGNILRTSLESKSCEASPITPHSNAHTLPSPNSNFELFKKRCSILHGMPPTSFIPNFTSFTMPKTSLNRSIPTKIVRNRENDVLEGCNALLSLGYQQ